MPKREAYEGPLVADGRNGMVEVWDKHMRKMRKVFPPDAREMIAMGSALRERPETESEERAPVEAAEPAAAPKPKR